MATVTGVTAARANEIEDNSVTGGSIVGNDLVLTTHDGTQINLGRVIPPPYLAWPVGSIFMNTSSANPATLLQGGTWVRWGKGKMPISLDEANTRFDGPEETGGSESVALTVAQLPSHAHSGATGYQSADHAHSGTTSGHTADHSHSAWTDAQGNHYHTVARAVAAGSGSPGRAAGGQSTALSDANTSEAGSHGHNVGVSGASVDHAHNFSTSGVNNNHYHAIPAEGSGQAHDNMPPFIAVYMWKRTA